MNRVIFPSGFEVVTDDLVAMQEFNAQQIKDRSKEIFNPGISGTYKQYVEIEAGAHTIKVLALNAYDVNGEKIVIPSDVIGLSRAVSGDRTLLIVGGFFELSAARYIIVARYKEIDTTPVVHPITLVSDFTRKEGSYTLHAIRRDGATPDSFEVGDIKLARIDVNSAGTITSVSFNTKDPVENFDLTDYFRLEASRVNTEIGATNPSLYSTGMQLTLQDHINCRGSGTILPANPHATALEEMAGTLSGQRLTDSSVSSDKIAAAAITNSLIAANAVDTAQIAPLAVGTTEMADLSVTNAKLASDAIRSSSYAFTIQGDAGVITKLIQRLVDRNITIESIILYADTAPIGASLIIDIKINGISLWNAHPALRPFLGAGENGPSTFSGTGAFDIATANTGDRLSMDITQVGSTTPGGNDLLVTIVYR